MPIAKVKKSKKKGSAKKAAPKTEGKTTLTTSRESLLNMDWMKPSEAELSEMRIKDTERHNKLEEAVLHQIDIFLHGSDKYQMPEYTIFDLFYHGESSPHEGIVQAEFFTENLIKFFLVPEHMTAFQAIYSHRTPAEIAAYLFQFTWAMRELSKEIPAAVFDRMMVSHSDLKELQSLLKKYSEANLAAANAYIMNINKGQL